MKAVLMWGGLRRGRRTLWFAECVYRLMGIMSEMHAERYQVQGGWLVVCTVFWDRCGNEVMSEPVETGISVL